MIRRGSAPAPTAIVGRNSTAPYGPLRRARAGQLVSIAHPIISELYLQFIKIPLTIRQVLTG